VRNRHVRDRPEARRQHDGRREGRLEGRLVPTGKHAPRVKALSQIVVEGVSGYKAELLALCWCRWGAEKEINYCRDFTSLSKSAIEKLKYYYSSLVVESSQEKSFLKDFEDFTTLREKPHCEEVPLGKIITETDLAAGEGLHSTLKRCKPNGMKFQTTR
jgi:hypothetical protein